MTLDIPPRCRRPTMQTVKKKECLDHRRSFSHQSNYTNQGTLALFRHEQAILERFSSSRNLAATDQPDHQPDQRPCFLYLASARCERGVRLTGMFVSRQINISASKTIVIIILLYSRRKPADGRGHAIFSHEYM